MTNEEIAKELFPYYEDMEDIELVQTVFKRRGAMEMAEWKDKQHSVAYVVTRSDMHYDEVEEVFFDIEKAEQYCARYNNNENEYRRNITKINVTL